MYEAISCTNLLKKIYKIEKINNDSISIDILPEFSLKIILLYDHVCVL